MFNPDNCPPSRRSETGSASASTVNDEPRGSAVDSRRGPNDDPRGSAVDSRRGPNRDRGEKEAMVVPHVKPKKTRGRVKIEMKFIKNKLRRCTTFSKRKTGIMKKAKELATLTGTQILLLVASETGHVYSNATYKLRPMLESDKGKSLIRTCLGSPDPPPHYDPSADPRISVAGYEESALSGGQQQPAAASGSEGQQGHAKDDMQLTFNEGGLPGAASNVQSVSPTTAPSGVQGSSMQPFPINYMQPVMAGSNFAPLGNGYAIMPAADFYNTGYSPSSRWQPYRADWPFTLSQPPSHHMQLTHTQAQQEQGFLTIAPPGSVQNQEDPMGSGPQQSGSSRNLTELQAANVDAAHYPNMQIYNASSMV